jgi:hypothetical protein
MEGLMDYLSNGMPGKGMGATSQAAKDFLKSRVYRDYNYNPLSKLSGLTRY